MELKFTLHNERLERNDNLKPIQYSRNINYATFNISGKLYKQEIFAIFQSSDGEKTIKFIGDGIGQYTVQIPNHCTTNKSFKVAIYSGDRVVSNFITIHNRGSLYEDGLTEEIIDDNRTLIDEIFDILRTKADKADTYSKLDIIGLLGDFYTMQEVDGLIDAIIQEVDDISEITNDGIYIIDDRVYVYNDGTLYDIMADEVVDVVENGNMSAVTSNAVYDALGDKQDVGNMVQTIASHSSADKYPSAKAVYDTLSGKEDISNKVANWSDTPTDDHYPSEKLVREYLDDAIYDLEDKIGSEGLQIKDFGNGIVLYYNDLERYLFVDTTVTVSNVALYTDTPIGNIPSRFAPPVTATNIDETLNYYIHIFSDGSIRFKNIKSVIDGTVAVKGMVQWLNVAEMEQIESSNGITLYELDRLRCLTVNYDNSQGENYIIISNAISQDAPETLQLGYAHNNNRTYIQISPDKRLFIYDAYQSVIEGMLFWYDTSELNTIRIPSQNDAQLILFYDDDIRILRSMPSPYISDGDTFTIPSEYAPPFDIYGAMVIGRNTNPLVDMLASIDTDGEISIISSKNTYAFPSQIIWFKEKPTGIYSYIQSIINNTP